MDDGREDKLPWVKWFWSDWKGEDGLRLVSLSAKGLWIEMLSIMASSKKKGYLLLIDKQMPSKDLAKLVGISEDETLGLLAELRDRGVFSETADGIIYNRRMVREAEISAIRSECGRMKGYSKSKREAKVKQNRSKGSAPCMSKTEGPSASASASAYASASISFNKNLNVWEGIGKKDKEGWKEAYPACDIDIELAGMREWFLSHPERAKRSNYRKFIQGWLSRKQDKGGTRRGLLPEEEPGDAWLREMEKEEKRNGKNDPKNI